MTLRGASDCVFWFSVRRQPKPSPQGGRTQAGVKGDGGAFGMVHRSTLSNSWGQRVPDAISVRASGRVGPGPPFQMAGSSESRTLSASGRAVGSLLALGINHSAWRILESRFFKTSRQSALRRVRAGSRPVPGRFLAISRPSQGRFRAGFRP